MINKAKNIYIKLRDSREKNQRRKRLKQYLNGTREPWSTGYVDFKIQEIKTKINSPDNLVLFKNNKALPELYGHRLDERVVEYSWIFSQLSDGPSKLLDAGSTFNFEYITSHPTIAKKDLTIYTFYPEEECYYKKRINYVFGDLRELPFKDKIYDEIVCQSTIEHIDMDNSMYGYELTSSVNQEKSYEYLKVIHEFLRTLNNKGTLLVTFPYGKFENHGFFQQFDEEMVARISEILSPHGKITHNYFQYQQRGWQLSTKEDCANCISFNPHTGVGKLEDGAAHSRAICCIKFQKISTKVC